MIPLTEEHIYAICDKMYEIYGQNSANPVQEPIRFNYQIRVALSKLGWKVQKNGNTQ